MVEYGECNGGLRVNVREVKMNVKEGEVNVELLG